ncbi:phosphoenolpyruvate synthase [Flavobacterium sp. F-380]|uniref:Phosphoenolpyruvate synthase n=2 Tax=Flavobacterium kayseriense TaxID=2764714 RepID=A0ABR7J4X6_9FLAO|nr:phosphoenolpyruvate synthase [Flavobacterium kayseriense]MBC5846734.1 phosphoenolpyruvate synthase [Flavobacterium kayseriense]
MMDFIKHFSEVSNKDVPTVGGKNASLGEMYRSLLSKGVVVPEGFAITSEGYWLFLNENEFIPQLTTILSKLDTTHFNNLSEIGLQSRNLILSGQIPELLKKNILQAYHKLSASVGAEKTFAVRSSATAEDLPTASFAGQQESYLNVKGEQNLIKACQRCYASLFTDRAIKYRVDNGFDHMKVALSIGVQTMIRSDIASSGVMFTLDPDSGFENTVLVSGAWGLGENVVQGTVNTDEFLVFKPLLDKVSQPIISRKLGSKIKTMVYSSMDTDAIVKPEEAIINLDTTVEKREQYILSDQEVVQLAKWACIIEKHYNCHMDIEWAKDGGDGKMYIVQARPETVYRNKKQHEFKQYTLLEKGNIICSGAGLGNKIVSGKARILHSPSEISKLSAGEILVTERTDPDWDPIMKKAVAIITDQGGRTSHAAIVARELGAVAVVGTGNGSKSIEDGQIITVSTARGNLGVVYDGILKWEEKTIDISAIPKTKTKVMLILAQPDEAFGFSLLPNDGVGLMRMEFIISNTIGIHPMALKHFDTITDSAIKEKIEKTTRLYKSKEDFFIQSLAEATAKMAAAFYPKEVIVRMSDFKSNEYANLLGGKQFEPNEENPMIGFRGASRYYHPLYKDAFEMECKAMKIVRDDMGLTNIKLMIPFCRSITEAEKVIAVMDGCGLKRNENGLELYVMIEIPSNALLAEEFAKYFDGFSIGSNDLTQLTLGADRDSELLSEVFNPFDPAVMQLIEMTLTKAKKTNTHTGLCGQAPSDYPEYAQFLVKNGIDSISFNPDALIKGIENIAVAEKQK